MGRSNKISEIKEILKEIFDNSFLDFNLIVIKKNWRKIVGNNLINHLKPEKIINEILFVKCDHSGWINILQFYKKEIMSRINSFFEKPVIKDIKFM